MIKWGRFCFSHFLKNKLSAYFGKMRKTEPSPFYQLCYNIYTIKYGVVKVSTGNLKLEKLSGANR